MMPGQHTEKAFETAIDAHLVSAGGYEKGDRETFDPVRGFFPLDILAFIKETQPQGKRKLKISLILLMFF